MVRNGATAKIISASRSSIVHCAKESKGNVSLLVLDDDPLVHLSYGSESGTKWTLFRAPLTSISLEFIENVGGQRAERTPGVVVSRSGNSRAVE